MWVKVIISTTYTQQKGIYARQNIIWQIYVFSASSIIFPIFAPHFKIFKIYLTRNTRSTHKVYHHMNFDLYEVERHWFVLLSYLSSEVSCFVLGLMSLSTYFGSYQDGACLWKTVWVAMDQLVCIELPFIHQVLNNGVSTTNLKCLVWLKRGIKPRTSQTQSKCSTIRLPVLLGSKV